MVTHKLQAAQRLTSCFVAQMQHSSIASGYERLTRGAPALQARVKQIKNLVADTEMDYEREKLNERIARLSGGVAIIQVRPPSAAANHRILCSSTPNASRRPSTSAPDACFRTCFHYQLVNAHSSSVYPIGLHTTILPAWFSDRELCAGCVQTPSYVQD